MHFNWIDWIIIVVLVYSLVDGWQRGLVALGANFISFLGSLWLAVRYHSVVGNFFTRTFGLTLTWSEVLGYLFVAVISQLCIESVCIALFARLPKKIRTSKANSWLGSLIAFVNSLVFMAFVLLLLLALPLRGTVKQDIGRSTIGNKVVLLAEQYGGQARSAVERIAKNATKFLTVEPGSQESIPLDIPKGLTNLSVDARGEQAMVKLVNDARAEKGIPALSVDKVMTLVAEEKSRDMFARRYFSHYDPDGKNAADRLAAAGIFYSIAGENLAYAPDFPTAHQGLMGSPGHRENILDPRFRRLGIGIIDGGSYGKMFTQEFAN